MNGSFAGEGARVVEYNTQLIAGRSSAQRIAPWNGTVWRALGSGQGQGAGVNGPGGLGLASRGGGLFLEARSIRPA